MPNVHRPGTSELPQLDSVIGPKEPTRQPIIEIQAKTFEDMQQMPTIGSNSQIHSSQGSAALQVDFVGPIDGPLKERLYSGNLATLFIQQTSEKIMHSSQADFDKIMPLLERLSQHAPVDYASLSEADKALLGQYQITELSTQLLPALYQESLFREKSMELLSIPLDTDTYKNQTQASNHFARNIDALRRFGETQDLDKLPRKFRKEIEALGLTHQPELAARLADQFSDLQAQIDNRFGARLRPNTFAAQVQRHHDMTGVVNDVKSVIENYSQFGHDMRFPERHMERLSQEARASLQMRNSFDVYGGLSHVEQNQSIMDTLEDIGSVQALHRRSGGKNAQMNAIRRDINAMDTHEYTRMQILNMVLNAPEKARRLDELLLSQFENVQQSDFELLRELGLSLEMVNGSYQAKDADGNIVIGDDTVDGTEDTGLWSFTSFALNASDAQKEIFEAYLNVAQQSRGVRAIQDRLGQQIELRDRVDAALDQTDEKISQTQSQLEETESQRNVVEDHMAQLGEAITTAAREGLTVNEILERPEYKGIKDFISSFTQSFGVPFPMSAELLQGVLEQAYRQLDDEATSQSEALEGYRQLRTNLQGTRNEANEAISDLSAELTSATVDLLTAHRDYQETVKANWHLLSDKEREMTTELSENLELELKEIAQESLLLLFRVNIGAYNHMKDLFGEHEDLLGQLEAPEAGDSSSETQASETQSSRSSQEQEQETSYDSEQTTSYQTQADFDTERKTALKVNKQIENQFLNHQIESQRFAAQRQEERAQLQEHLDERAGR